MSSLATVDIDELTKNVIDLCNKIILDISGRGMTSIDAVMISDVIEESIIPEIEELK